MQQLTFIIFGFLCIGLSFNVAELQYPAAILASVALGVSGLAGVSLDDPMNLKKVPKSKKRR